MRRSLKAGDGAQFFGTIERMEGGLFRASCYAQLGLETDTREFRMCPTEADAEKWIARRATRRGFLTYKKRTQ